MAAAIVKANNQKTIRLMAKDTDQLAVNFSGELDSWNRVAGGFTATFGHCDTNQSSLVLYVGFVSGSTRWPLSGGDVDLFVGTKITCSYNAATCTCDGESQFCTIVGTDIQMHGDAMTFKAPSFAHSQVQIFGCNVVVARTRNEDNDPVLYVVKHIPDSLWVSGPPYYGGKEYQEGDHAAWSGGMYGSKRCIYERDEVVLDALETSSVKLDHFYVGFSGPSNSEMSLYLHSIGYRFI